MKWTRGQVIGRGSTATVSTAVLRPSGQLMAVKTVDLSRRNLLHNEQKLHSTIQSPYIIQYKGQDITLENGSFMYNIFTEYASGGSLAEKTLRSNSLISQITRRILKGLEYLHSKGIVHCDIKPSNILLTADGDAKIADLGCSRLAADMAASDWSIAGTPIYMAPEVARGERQGYAADVWALGCTVIEMAAGRAPWPGVSDPVSALYQIGFSGRVPEIPEGMSCQAKGFLFRCLERDPERRWSVAQLLQHPFVAETKPGALPDLLPGHGPDKVSPTSVLGYDFREPNWGELGWARGNLDDGPARRVHELVGSTVGPGWEQGEGKWVTVRDGLGCEKDCFCEVNEVESDVDNEDGFMTHNGDYYIDDFSGTSNVVYGSEICGLSFVQCYGGVVDQFDFESFNLKILISEEIIVIFEGDPTQREAGSALKPIDNRGSNHTTLYSCLPILKPSTWDNSAPHPQV